MFDIGFWELVFIAIVALLVIGPDKLPAVARTAGVWVGRARNFVASVKADINQELKAEELKQMMEKQAELSEVQEIVDETKSTVDEVSKQDYALHAIRDRDQSQSRKEKPDAEPSDRSTGAKASNDGTE